MAMVTDTSEAGLEATIEGRLLQQAGYLQSADADYDRALCLDARQLFAFLEATQPQKLAAVDSDKLLKRLSEKVRERGVVEILRNGIRVGHWKFRLYYPHPASYLNPQAWEDFKANRFSVTRQLHFSQYSNQSLDLAIFVNGLPLITFELKNNLTKQNVADAVQQYRDRDPKVPLFRFGRCLVHFAVDDQEVHMTTELKGQDTYFLPFNQGKGYRKPIPEAIHHGAGNPVNPGGLKTAYLWERFLTKEVLSEIIEKYARIVVEKDPKTHKKKPPKLIFPRFHQFDVVRKLLDSAKQRGPGKRYLIQHSTGSGKSYSIAWLAHQLVELTNSNDAPIFDSVIVVTDRVVLHRQIRDTIRQYAHVAGVVFDTKSSGQSSSSALAEALQEGRKIIISTVQTFPFVIEKIGALGDRNFAIIIDEAHSSQGGTVSAKMNLALGQMTGEDFEEPEDIEDAINLLIESQKMLSNASYFAFTATPKSKTLELFGEQYPNGKSYPFHVYTMKQAIEERFILDVLQHYTTYETYYLILKKIEDDPQFDAKLAHKRLKRWVEGNPYAIEQKTKVMVNHFLDEVLKPKKIGGRARAMIVTRGRLDAVKYKLAFDEYLEEIDSPYKALVAFSGSVTYKGKELDEANMNGFPSRDITGEFENDPYRFLIVAEKFQTGFDQPLLHTMYVDKDLSDVKAVQTLSRLNRSHPQKQDTFVLDFVNSSERIRKSFEPFYKTTILSEQTDFDRLNDLQYALDAYQVYSEAQVIQFTDLYFSNAPREELDPILDVCADLYRLSLDEEEQIDFKAKAKSFVRTYQFLAQILPFNDVYKHRLQAFLKFLLTKLPAPEDPDYIQGLLESVDIDSYRVEHEATLQIMLEGNEEVDPVPVQVKGTKYLPEMDWLSHIIEEFNQLYGNTEWAQDDKVQRFMFEDLPREVAAEEEYQNAKAHSDRQNARITFEKILKDKIYEYIHTQTDFVREFTQRPEFREWLAETLFRRDYDHG